MTVDRTEPSSTVCIRSFIKLVVDWEHIRVSIEVELRQDFFLGGNNHNSMKLEVKIGQKIRELID